MIGRVELPRRDRALTCRLRHAHQILRWILGVSEVAKRASAGHDHFSGQRKVKHGVNLRYS
jgi:hypothetical protein